MAVKVTGLRTFQSSGSACAYFDIEIDLGQGAAFVIRKNTLFRSTRDDGYFWKGPSAPQRKNGEDVVDAEGRKQYDDFIRFTFTEDKKRTSASNAFIDAVTAQAVALLTGATQESRGRGAPAKKAATPKAKPATVATRTDDVEDIEDEDDLPY